MVKVLESPNPNPHATIDLDKPDIQTRVHKECAESDQFWEILGGKTEHPTQKIPTTAETDPHLFSCTLTKDDDLKLYEIYNFKKDDLLIEDVYIIDVHSSIFIWKPKKRAPVSFGGRSGSEKPQRSRSVSFGSDRPRARGRSPAFNSLASKFDNPTAQRNLSTPPPLVKKLYPKVGSNGDACGGVGDNNKYTSKLPADSIPLNFFPSLKSLHH